MLTEELLVPFYHIIGRQSVSLVISGLLLVGENVFVSVNKLEEQPLQGPGTL